MLDALRPIPPPEISDTPLLDAFLASPFSELQTFLALAHNPDLVDARRVYQVWEDGEITVQKGGDRLWTEPLRVVCAPLPFVGISMPVPSACGGGHSYAVVTKGDAHHIRDLLCRVAGRPDPLRTDARQAAAS